VFIGEARERALLGHMLMINFIFSWETSFGLGRLLSYARSLSLTHRVYIHSHNGKLSLRDFFLFHIIVFLYFSFHYFSMSGERKIAIFFRKKENLSCFACLCYLSLTHSILVHAQQLHLTEKILSRFASYSVYIQQRRLFAASSLCLMKHDGLTFLYFLSFSSSFVLLFLHKRFFVKSICVCVCRV
jgi:hypothetical protein